MTTHETLKQYFGYDEFREGQEPLINGILARKDALGIMPTGAGKSLCFQVPALMFEGITLVVSPLISLMKDQVNALTQSGVAAAFINSTLTETQVYKALSNAENGKYKLIYTAPERLLSGDFLSFAKNANISMVVVDEAHCISQWGQDFRPSYAKIPMFISHLQSRPIVSAFTATATPRVREDVVLQLELKTPTVLVSSFDRPNLYFSVEKPADKFGALAAFLQDKKQQSGIVYCSTRAAVEEVCEKLNQNGFCASRYHAGLSDSERHLNQDNFRYDRVNIMVATNAFGMGINKSNVSFVVHYNMPRDLEGYYQEAGRAGRDGEPADCLLLYGKMDVQTNLWLINNSGDVLYESPEAEREIKDRNIKRLYEMDLYCTMNGCLREYILKYFGETPPNSCDGCANCNAGYEKEDVTIDAQQIISCVSRMKERFGTRMVIDVLRGKATKKVVGFGFEQLSTFGISNRSADRLEEIINQMINDRYLVKPAGMYPILKLGENARDALRQDASVCMKMSSAQRGYISAKNAGRNLADTKYINKDLMAKLKDLRLEIANEQKVPAFIVFHDSSIVDMCVKLPTTPEKFKSISGVGSIKAENYGTRFSEVIRDFIAANGLDSLSQDNAENESIEFDPAKVEITDGTMPVSHIADRINCVLIEMGHKKITAQRINDWLVATGHMHIVKDGAKAEKRPTEKGNLLGITTESRIIQGTQRTINYYNREAQEFVVQNAMEVFKL